MTGSGTVVLQVSGIIRDCDLLAAANQKQFDANKCVYVNGELSPIPDETVRNDRLKTNKNDYYDLASDSAALQVGVGNGDTIRCWFDPTLGVGGHLDVACKV